MPKLGLTVAIVILFADWVSKYLLIGYMTELGHGLYLLPFVNLVMVWNPGISFGLFASPGGQRWILVILSMVIVIGLMIWLRRTDRRLLKFAIGGLIGGALGNVWDRVYYGAVADFFDIHVFGYHWPAFNIADSAITIGVVLIIYDAFVTAKDEPKEGKDSEQE